MSDLPRGQMPPEDFDLGEVEDGDEEIQDTGADEGDLPEGGDGEADGEPAEGSDDAEDEEAGEASPRPVARRPGRSARLRETNQRLERELAELRGRFDGFSQQQQMPRAPDPAEIARQQAAEQERLSMMSPQEVAAYYYQKGQGEVRQYLQMQDANLKERIDKQAYDAAARSSKAHRDNRAEVERIVAEQRKLGFVAERETVLDLVIGKQVRQRGEAAAPRQRQAAQRRVQGQQTRPTGSRGDAAAGRRPAADSYEASLARIAGKPIF